MTNATFLKIPRPVAAAGMPLMLCAGIFMQSLPSLARTATPIDPTKTRISFEIDAVGWPTTRGTFTAFEGTIAVDLEKPTQSSVLFRVNAASVDAGSAGITSYVKSESMLNVAKFPAITFRSSSVQKTGERSVKVTGDLNFYGTELPASFDVDVDRQPQGKALSFTARGVIKRSAFGFISGQPLISDDVKITVTTIGRAE